MAGPVTGQHDAGQPGVDGAYRHLIVAEAGGVIEITMSRPEQLNAFNPAMHDELRHAFETIARGSDARAVILAGAGRAFSAGGDLDWIERNHHDPAARIRAGAEGRGLLLALVDCPLPVIAAVHGDAIGVGATIAMAADAIVASRNARFGDPHVLVGLTAGDGGCALWPASTGMLLAKRYLLTGELIPAEEAWRMAMVTDLVDGPGDVMDKARQIAARIAALPPFAVQSTKRTFNAALRARVEEVGELGLNYLVQSYACVDVPEAVAALKERRPGNFKGFG